MKLSQKYNIVKNTLKENGWHGFTNLMFTWLSLIREPASVRSKPIFVQIEPTVDCNLKCKMCISPFFKRKNRALTLVQFKKIIDQFPYLRKISLVGAGEPLLNPELFSIIKYAKSKDLIIGFASNATLLDKDISQKIISSQLDWLNISLDGATKQTYEKIRKGADFNLVLENIANLMQAAEEGKKPEIAIWFLALKSNIAELPELILLASRFGIKNLYLQTPHYWANSLWRKKRDEESIDSWSDQLKQVLARATYLAKEKRVKFKCVNFPDRDKSRSCQWPWSACYITTDGYVTPCCLHGTDPTILNFGNIFEKEFDAIWNNQLYQDFRKQLKSDTIPHICLDCPSYCRSLKI